MCDDKHTRTKIRKLNDQSDYSAPVKFKARNSVPKNYLFPLQTEEVKQWIFKLHHSIQFPSQLVSCQQHNNTLQ